MRSTIVILALMVYGSSFAQNRKELIKEIYHYKTKTIESTYYVESKDSLTIILNSIFYKIGYQLRSKTDSNIVFYKKIRCLAEKQFLSDNTDRNLLSKSNKSKQNFRSVDVNFYVTIDLLTYKSKIIPQISSILDNNYANKNKYSQDVLSGGTNSVAVSSSHKHCFDGDGNFEFDSLSIKKKLYVHFYGNKISLSKELLSKIDSYNNLQTKDKKKLLTGRDY